MPPAAVSNNSSEQGSGTAVFGGGVDANRNRFEAYPEVDPIGWARNKVE
jgi:hypothetical protein